VRAREMREGEKERRRERENERRREREKVRKKLHDIFRPIPKLGRCSANKFCAG
jgi:hypothetical protein